MKPIETLLKAFVELHPDDAARAFEALPVADRVRVFRSTSDRIALALVERIGPHVSAPLLCELSEDRQRQLLTAMPPRIASSVLHQLEEPQREALLSALTTDIARSLRSLARYPGETAGAMMEPRVVSLSIDVTVQQAIAAVRKAPRDALHYLYITQRDGKLIGVLNMRDLVISASRDPIAPLVHTDVVSVPEMMHRDEVVDLLRERGFLALPVVDFDGRLIGVVRHAEVLEAGQEAVFEDLQKIVGAGADERALSPVRMVVKSRLPWLIVNLVTAFMAAAVVGVFEGVIAKVAALAVLLPVVAGQGGNTGSQSLAVVMRGLALREIIPGVEKRVVMKELAGGALNGVAVAFVTSLAVFSWRLIAGDAMQAGIGLSLVIGLAMIVNMAAAALSGAVIPLILQAVGRDPAQSASIFLTTVTDIVGFASFLGFATLFMPMISGN